VTSASRRIFIYWALLLVPTLAVGAGALLLLRREQARLAERAAYADEARRAAVAARTRLIVESVELLIGDVQNGVLDTVAAEPEQGLDAFLDRWERANPLVRTTFRCTADGRMLRPDPRAADENARGFLRRFARQFNSQPPWSSPPSLQDSVKEEREQKRVLDVSARRDVAANVAQLQSARRDVQELFKVTQQSAAAPQAGETAGTAAAARPTRETDAPRSSAQRPAASSDVADARDAREAGRSEPSQIAAQVRAKEAVPDRRGWLPTLIDGRLHVVGWVQPAAGGDVRGVELELVALIARMGSALPADAGGGEGYALRDDQRRVLNQVGAVPRAGEPAVRVPIAASLLPGWEAVAHIAPAAYAGDGATVMGLGGLLVALFIAAILAGGSLLLWQARRSEEEAAQKTSFVANVSHEFKTPLTTIRLYSELLEQGRVRDREQGREYLRTIGRETQRLARLVNNALDFSRLEQGRKKYARQEIDLTTEVARLLDTHAPRIVEAGLTLERSLPDAPVRVTTDRDALEQIVLNVIDNACKYAAPSTGSGQPAAGEVRVVLTKRAGASATGSAQAGAEIRVQDRGPGVPAEHRARIFEKFHRVDQALTAEKSGTGLGLSIARQLARGLGGELRYAEREGGGAEFILELP
jgi:two-component system, OmpR family, phosphate regulon sensor histidine kinase PhoR